jgi:ABC-type sugar transport system ATPase subunit
MAAPTGEPFVRLTGISRSFGHIEALAEVDADVHRGEVLAVVGDNGAGKSTLMKVLIGLHRPTAGTVLVEGREVHFSSPSDAVAAGISAVTQDLALVEVLDVATNMFLGQIPRRRGLVDRRRMERETRRFLDGVQATVPDVRTAVGMLSGGQRQMVAIARALRGGAELVVMDEPTAALGVRETAQVTELIGRLRDQGKAVVVVSHDMDLVFQVADRVLVMRRGRNAGVLDIARTDRAEVVGMITGGTNRQVSVDA